MTLFNQLMSVVLTGKKFLTIGKTEYWAAFGKVYAITFDDKNNVEKIEVS